MRELGCLSYRRSDSRHDGCTGPGDSRDDDCRNDGHV